MQLIMNTDAPLSETDLVILKALVDQQGAVETPAEKTVSVKPVENSRADLEKPAAEPEEDVVGGAATPEDAVKQATAAVANGKTAAVRAALAAAGAKRVSELSGDAIGKFLSTLNAS